MNTLLNRLLITVTFIFVICQVNHAQLVSVGSGSYTTTFPGVDVAGRNSYPSDTPYLTGNAIGKPVPTSDWWSTLVKKGTASNLFNYPYTLKTVSSGLVVSYIPWGVIDDLNPMTVGIKGLNATKTYVSDYSDWTVTMDWNDGSHDLKATSGVGMPFLYFTKRTTDEVQISFTSGSVVISNEMLICTNVKNGADFVVYAPSGSIWNQSGSVYTSTLNGKKYWSVAFIPLTASNVTTVANEYKKYAYVFPLKTMANYSYNESSATIRTDFTVETEVKEGTETNMLLGLLPHQWGHLASNSPIPNKYSYATVRGEMKTLAGNAFSVENKFKGVLPTLPYVDNYSAGFSPDKLAEKVASLENTEMATWTDSYNEGQVFNQLLQTARIAHEMGNTLARDKMLNTIKTRLENWFKAESGEVAFLFYYNATWSSMLGYPAGYGQDSGLNDKQFHWGYFIQAAAFVQQFDPAWAAQWGQMVNMLVRDAAAYDRNDTMFPYLRNFNPYSGHCWVDGFAENPQGNNQESSSESMNFNTALILWGQASGNKTIRDLGIYLYTTEQTAIEEYYLDTHDRNFPASQQYSLVSRVWGNSFDNGTFWTGDIAASYGIEMYPIQGGSLYLGQDTLYAKKLWKEILSNTGIAGNQVNPNLWHDIMWEFEAFTNPSKAIERYNSFPNRELKFGVSDAQTYHWLHAMNVLGRVDAGITADYPVAAAFRKGNSTNYVAQNFTSTPITVTFSDGYQLVVPAHKLATNLDSNFTGVITSSFSEAYVNGSVNLTVEVSGGTPTKIEFMDGGTSVGIVNSAPYRIKAGNLQKGKHNFYARIYDHEKFNVSNTVQVIVGEQLPFGGSAWAIPGTIEAGKYDIFEAGEGQNISYFDATTANLGDYRMDEAVDVAMNTAEGSTIGWISNGEWVEYTVNIAQTGMYSMDFRYSSGNANGGGPFHIEIDDQPVTANISVPSTSTTVWDTFASKTVSDLPLTEGKHILKVAFSAGEFNLGKLTFARTGDLPYSYPTAHAGADMKILLPQTTAALDGSASTESASKTLTYKWEQIYGPSVIVFSSKNTAKSTISGLEEGMYKVKLTVTNPDSRSSFDEQMIVVTSTANIAPNVSILEPSNNSTFKEGTEITISANADDYDGTIQNVEFYQNGNLISTDNTAPYSILWKPASAGTYALTAKATDNGGVATTSTPIHVTFSHVSSCSEISTDATQGAFTTGYNCTFETVNTDVTITWELLDDKTGVVAYLWTESPFSEKLMTNVEGNKFSTTLNNQTLGSTIKVACKFAYTGGMAVTKYISYTVGKDCGSVVDDTEAPANFTASVGNITQNSIELILNATDNSGVVVYQISEGSNSYPVSALSGVQKSYILQGLTSDTDYSISVSAMDQKGNKATNNPIILNAKTLKDTNTECEGIETEASVGSFSSGYKYKFETTGTDVNISFELLDDKAGLVAYFWDYTNGFTESGMTKGEGNKFTKSFTGQVSGTEIKFACKFAFAGGMSVTKQFTYSVGRQCDNTGFETITDRGVFVYPNPVKDNLIIVSKTDISDVKLVNVVGEVIKNTSGKGTKQPLDMSDVKSGNYLVIVNLSDGNVIVKKIVKI